MKKNSFMITDWIHQILSLYVKEGDWVIDATAGKGKDTLFLNRMAGISGKVFAFDIQKEAIDAAKELIKQEGIPESVEFILDGHEHMDQYVEQGTVSAILFNLGYLPGGNHRISTKKETTVDALKKSLKLLKSEGMLCVCIYSGADTGFEEKEAVLEYIKSLPAREYDVICNSFMNKPNHPPLPVFIRKK